MGIPPLSKLNTLLSATALTALGALGSAALAKEPSALPVVGTVKVSLVGLDLSTAEGVSAAHERVRMAARRICAKVAMSADMSTSLRYITCIDEAMTNSVTQIAELARNASAQRLARNPNN
jgi:UrcA family protein